jgi:APA family basic amino acid/polyamine antiporter
MILALTFARLSRLMPKAGGPYAYTRVGFGDFPAFLVAWGYWISVCAGNAAIAVALVGYLAFFWRPLAENPAMAAATAVASIWMLTWVNARGVRQAGGMQLVTTILKLLPLIAIGTVGLLYLDFDNFTPFNTSGQSTISAITATAALTLWAFLGVESATIPAGNVEQPERTIPLATILGTVIAALVYISGTVAVMGILPQSVLVNSTAPFADAASSVWGSWAAGAVAAGAAFSCFGALNGWIMLQGQFPLAVAMDGLFPTVFARVSKQGTPVTGLVLSSVLVTLIVSTNYTRGLVGAFTFIILLATVTVLVPYVFSSMTLVLLALRDRSAGKAARIAAPVTLGSLAFLYSLWAVAGSGRDAVFWGFLLLLAGLPAYVWIVRTNIE